MAESVDKIHFPGVDDEAPLMKLPALDQGRPETEADAFLRLEVLARQTLAAGGVTEPTEREIEAYVEPQLRVWRLSRKNKPAPESRVQ